MDLITNLLFGNLGEAFPIIKERQKLFTEQDFEEFNDELYERYYKMVGMPSLPMYVMGFDEVRIFGKQ